jgi:hypothetical protein
VNVPHWADETSGLLQPVVGKYLRGEELVAVEIALMRSYLQQWIDAAFFFGLAVDPLRRRVHAIRSDADVRAWLAAAHELGLDPL